MTATWIVLAVVIAVGVLAVALVRRNTGAGRDRIRATDSDDYARQRLERGLEEHGTIEKAEARFQREQAEKNLPPTHES